MRGGVRSREASPKNKLERGSKESKREVRLEEDDRRAMEEEEKRIGGRWERREEVLKKRGRATNFMHSGCSNFSFATKIFKGALSSTPPFFNPSSAAATQLIGFINACTKLNRVSG
jgi:hypothetical protein